LDDFGGICRQEHEQQRRRRRPQQQQQQQQQQQTTVIRSTAVEAPSLIFGDCQKIVNVSQKIVTQTSQPRLLLSLWSRGFCQNFCSKKFGTGSPKKRKHAENEPLSFRMFNNFLQLRVQYCGNITETSGLGPQIKNLQFFPNKFAQPDARLASLTSIDQLHSLNGQNHRVPQKLSWFTKVSWGPTQPFPI